MRGQRRVDPIASSLRKKVVCIPLSNIVGETRWSVRQRYRDALMQGKQQPVNVQEESHHRLQVHQATVGLRLAQLGCFVESEELEQADKTRSTTPVLANDGCSGTTGVGGGFWLASVAAGAGTGAGLPPHAAHPTMDPNCGPAETGFINSQPSMAEFMTALPQLAGDGPIQHSPGAGGPMSPGTHHPGYHTMLDPHAVADPSGVNVPEYPWMKEKKTTRKNNQQGKIYRDPRESGDLLFALV